MEGWRVALCEGYDRSKEKADRSIEGLRSKLQHVLKRMPCVKCGSRVLEGDLLDLRCKKNVSHLHCFDCIQDIMERQMGYMERCVSDDVRKEYPLVQNMVLCTLCHIPAVVQQSSSFVTGFAQKQSGAGGRIQYRLIHHVTKAVRQPENHHVEEYYENQRRGPFGKFKAKLLPTDKRGLISTKEGLPRNVTDLNRIANDELWLNLWQWDCQLGDPQGWQYAFNWPESALLKWGTWVNAPSSRTFVRRRRMLRTKVKLLSELSEVLLGDPAAPSDSSPFSPMSTTGSTKRSESSPQWDSSSPTSPLASDPRLAASERNSSTSADRLPNTEGDSSNSASLLRSGNGGGGAAATDGECEMQRRLENC